MTFRSVQNPEKRWIYFSGGGGHCKCTDGLLPWPFWVRLKRSSILFMSTMFMRKFQISLERLVRSLAQVSDVMPSPGSGHDLVVFSLAAEIFLSGGSAGSTAGITALTGCQWFSTPTSYFMASYPVKRTADWFLCRWNCLILETQIFYESPYRVADTLKIWLRSMATVK